MAERDGALKVRCDGSGISDIECLAASGREQIEKKASFCRVLRGNASQRKDGFVEESAFKTGGVRDSGSDNHKIHRSSIPRYEESEMMFQQ